MGWWNGPQPSLRALLREVSRVSDIPISTILSERKCAAFTHARMAYCWLARNYTDHSWEVIALTIGKHHTTAVHAAKRCAMFRQWRPSLQCSRWSGAVEEKLAQGAFDKHRNPSRLTEGDLMRMVWA